MERNLIFSTTFMRNYLLFATVVSLAFFAIFYFYYRLAVYQAVVDAFLSFFILCLMLLSFYFVVRFARTEKLTSFSSIRNSSAAGLIMITLWLFITRYILEFFFAGDEVYIRFLYDSQLLRFLTGFFITGLVYMSFFLLIYEKMVDEASTRENELKLLVHKTELQALKNQLNPHFIYNSLNSISALTLYSPDKAREMVGMLSDFLRIALRQDAMQMEKLGQELKNIDLYLQIEKVRFEERLNWEFNVDDNLLHYTLPVMILQPLVENAVKHGVQQNAQPNVIKLAATFSNNSLFITITNSIDVGFQKFKGEGVGLDNIRNRLRLIYGSGSLLKVDSGKEIFSVNLEIPQ